MHCIVTSAHRAGRRLAFGAALACALLAAARPQARADGAPGPRPEAGEIVSLGGVVTAADESGAGGPERALRAVGEPVFVGDSIRTAKGAQIKILMKDLSILALGSEGQLKVRQYDVADDRAHDIQVDLDHGQLRGVVSRKLGGASKFQIRTKTATMGVRGTELVVNASSANRTEVTVLQGRVAVEPAGLALMPGQSPPLPTFVSSGRQLVVAEVPQQPNVFTPAPSVVSVPAEKLERISQSIQVADTVLKSALSFESRENSVAVSSEATQMARSPASATGGSSSQNNPTQAQPSLITSLTSGAPAISPRAGTNPTLTVTIIRP